MANIDHDDDELLDDDAYPVGKMPEGPGPAGTIGVVVAVLAALGGVVYGVVSGLDQPLPGADAGEVAE